MAAASASSSFELSCVSVRVAKGPAGSVVRNLSARPERTVAGTDTCTGLPATTEKVVFWPHEGLWVPGGQWQT